MLQKQRMESRHTLFLYIHTYSYNQKTQRDSRLNDNMRLYGLRIIQVTN